MTELSRMAGLPVRMVRRTRVAALAIVAVVLLGLASAPPAHAQSPAVPPELAGWQDWVLHGQEARRCAWLLPDVNQRLCAWPSQLAIDADARGARFTQRWTADAPTWLPLPGDAERWPEDVTIDGRAAPVVDRGGPHVYVARGSWSVAGTFRWGARPESLRIPDAAALVALAVDGREVRFPERAGSMLVLGARAQVQARDELRVEVYRLLADEQPAILTTRVRLDVAGEAREVVLPKPLPAGFVPMQLEGELPARLEPDGRLRVQVRPGRFTLELRARAPGVASAVTLAEAAAPWPAQEVWSFWPVDVLRVAAVEGVPAIDPAQAGVPGDWAKLPAYQLTAGATLQVVERSRGLAADSGNDLQLRRVLWRDFDRGGWTVVDRIGGRMREDWRLDLAPPYSMQSAQERGESLLVTRAVDRSGRDGAPAKDEAGDSNAADAADGVAPGSAAAAARASGPAGVELRSPTVDVRTLARIDAGTAFPATGYTQRFANVSGELRLPPGERLLAVLGADAAPSAWLERWHLLDVFLVLLVAAAAWRVVGLRLAIVALLALVLTYHESGAPTWLWVNLVVALALAAAAPEGRLRTLAEYYRSFAFVIVLVALLPFGATQARLALYPQLEAVTYGTSLNVVQQLERSRRGASAPLEDVATAPAADAAAPAGEAPAIEMAEVAPSVEVPAAAPSPEFEAPSGRSAVGASNEARRALAKMAPRPYAAESRYAPGSVVQAGPGMPTWRYEAHPFSWSGPVEAEQDVRFVVAPRALVSAWRVLGILLSVALLAGCGAYAWARLARVRSWLLGPRTASSAVVVAAVALVGTLGVPQDARAATTPDPQLLDQLRARLLEPPKCAPQCAEITAARVSIAGDRLEVVLDVGALDRVAVPLPAAEPHWAPDALTLNGAAGVGVHRDGAGQRWLAVPAGAHTVRIAGAIAGVDAVKLAFPLVPRVVDVSASGWDAAGVVGRRLVGGAVDFARRRAPAGATATSGAEPLRGAGEFPPWVVVERTFRIGLDWTVDTRVVRRAPVAGAFTVRVPLLLGEALVTPGLETVDGAVVAGFGAGTPEVDWSAALTRTATLELVAPDDPQRTELWLFDVSPIWHASFAGVPALQPSRDAEMRWTFEYWPRAGEKLRVAFARPEPVAGGTLAFDAAQVQVVAGQRTSDVRLVLAYRATQGSRHVLKLPAAARVTEVLHDGEPVPVRPDRGELALGLSPGEHSVSIAWEAPEGATFVTTTPTIAVGAPVANVESRLVVPQQRWVLYAWGEGVGPAVLYWGELVVFVVLAWWLGRSGLTPLGVREWLLLGLGLSTFSWLALGIVAAWFVLYRLRERATRELPWSAYNARQIALAVLAVVALGALLAAIPQGLLATPDMRIAQPGGGEGLAWFVDRTDGVLPTPSILSVPLWWYKAAMLAWALWLSFALTRWVKWTWSVYSRDGLWRDRTDVSSAPTAGPRSASAEGAASSREDTTSGRDADGRAND